MVNRVKGYADLFHLHEDARIEIIGKRAAAGERVGFVVEDNVKADRYIKKLAALFPVEVAKRGDGPVKDTVYVIVTRRAEDERRTSIMHDERRAG